MTSYQTNGQYNKQYLSVRSASEMYDISENTLRTWIRERRIGVVRVGSLVRIPLVELDKITNFAPSRPDRVGRELEKHI